MSKFKFATLLLIVFSIFAAHQASAFGLSETEKACAVSKKLIPLQVPIIGVCVESPSVCCSEDGNATVAVKGAPDYITVFFRFGIIFISIVLVGVLVLAGLMYVSSGGNPAIAAKALGFVKNAAYSLVVLIFSAVILNQIDPRLTSLQITEVIKGVDAINCCKTTGFEEYYYQSMRGEPPTPQCKSGDAVVKENACTALVSDTGETVKSLDVVDTCEIAGRDRISGEAYTPRDLQIVNVKAKTVSSGKTIESVIQDALNAVHPDARITLDVVAAIISQETSGDPNKMAAAPDADGKYAWGMMQVKFATAQQECSSDGIQTETDLKDPVKGTVCGIRILNNYLKKTGSLRGAVGAYNTGIVKTKACAGMSNDCRKPVFGWECLYDLADGGKRVPNYQRPGNQVNTRNYVSNVMAAIGYCPGNPQLACQ